GPRRRRPRRSPRHPPATAAASRWTRGRWAARTRAATAARSIPSATAPTEVLALPPAPRPAAPFALLDITKFYGPATGGIRTYLHAKAAWTAGRPGIRHAVVVPGAADGVADRDG